MSCDTGLVLTIMLRPGWMDSAEQGPGYQATQGAGLRLAPDSQPPHRWSR